MTPIPITPEPTKVRPGEDTRRLNWLIKNGYTPARWRPWTPADGPHDKFPNGMVMVGMGGRAEIDAALAATKGGRK